jgi:DNA-directed RNA polymerase subunit RPC12/RpoP
MAKLVLLEDGLAKLGACRAMLKIVCSMYGLEYNSGLGFLDDEALDLETVMTYLNLRRQLFESRVQEGVTAEDILKELAAYVILRALQGPECNLHRRLARRMNPNDVILSFNYDTVFDAALRREKKIDDGSYCVPFYGVMRDVGSEKITNVAGTTELIKLHGSLNWAKCVECSALNLVESPLSIIHLEKGGPDLKCPRCGGGKSSQKVVIIPPLQSKEYSDDPFRFLWMHAAKKLQGITRIVAIGYRFSGNDRATEILLRYGIGPNTKVQVQFINKSTTEPRSDFEQRFSRIFPNAKQPEWSDSLSEYLA